MAKNRPIRNAFPAKNQTDMCLVKERSYLLKKSSVIGGSNDSAGKMPAIQKIVLQFVCKYV